MKTIKSPIFLTGASGFLGGALAKRLHRLRFPLRLLLRRKARPPFPPGEGVEIVRGDITEPGSYRSALQNCEVVFHCAALVRNWVPDRMDFYRINVDALSALIHTAVDSGVKKLIYTSSFIALGASDGEPLSENSPPPTYRAYNEYEDSKRKARAVARRLSRLGFPLVTCIPGVIYGPGALTAGNHLMNLIRRRLAGKDALLPRMADKLWNFSYIDDVVEGHILAMRRGESGEEYILGGENATIDRFFSLLAEKTGCAKPCFGVPFIVAKIRAALFDRWYYPLLKGEEPQITTGVLGIYSRNWAISSRKAETELGYRRRGLDEGLSATLRWMDAQVLVPVNKTL